MELKRKMEKEGLSKLQAVFRGRRSREIHGKRAKNGAAIVCPFVSANVLVVDKLLQLVGIDKHDTVLDIGSGDGTILIEIAFKFGVQCLGVEIDEVLCRTARRRIEERKLSSCIDIIIGDALYVQPLLKFPSVVTIFLVPSCLKILSPIILASCKSGTKIVNIKFPMPEEDGWIALNTIECEDVVKPGSLTKIYLYVIN